jgi:outer membrane protein assembly factor BamB
LQFKTLNVLGLLVVLSLALAACGGAQQTQAFPGLVTDGELTFLAEGQFVRAVDVAAQQQRWQFPPVQENMYGVFVSTPAIEGERIVVASEGPSGSYSGAVFGLDRATGERDWCLIFDNKAAQRLASLNCTMAQLPESRNLFGIGGAVDNRIIGGLTLVDGQVYFGMANGRVYAVDAATGQDLWFVQAGRDVWSAPIVTEDVVYFGSLDHYLYAIDRASGDELWKRDVGAAVAGKPTLHEDRLYVGTFGSTLYALDAATGEPVWPAPFRAANWVWDGPTVVDDLLYITDVSGAVYAVEAASGEQRWVQKPGAAMRARPAAGEAALYVGDRSSNLYALNPDNGSTLWAKTLTGKGQVLATPLVLNDFIVVAPFSGSNKLEVYRANGDFYWAFTPGN